MRKISISQDFIMEKRYKYFIFKYATELHVPFMPEGFTFSPLENV